VDGGPRDDVWVRHAVRVLLLDETSRVLLMSMRVPDDGRIVWFAPGGGMEPGESEEDTARRELAEEIVGPASYELRGPVWTRRHPHVWAGRRIDLHESYFVSRVSATQVRDVRETEGGAAYFQGWRWWTLEELSSFDGLVAPRRIAELLRPIVAGDLPEAPIDAGV
jgi:8-oxo-dGTP pyrophosphatase MutT (NUDIX family)